MSAGKAVVVSLVLAAAGAAIAAPPFRYTIVDLGSVGDDAMSQGVAGSPQGAAAGTSYGSASTAFSWTRQGSLQALPSPADHPWVRAGGLNDGGTVVGTAATHPFGFNPLPVMWQQGELTVLPLPAGYPYGRAYGVNGAGVVVGMVGGNGPDRGYVYANGVGRVITPTLPGGGYLAYAYAINDSGRVVGYGIDPNDLLRNVAFVIDLKTRVTRDLVGLPGRDGGFAYGVSNAGHVVGVAMQGQQSGVPFIWSESQGMVEIPLPAGTSSAQARGVNSAGVVVGYGSGLFAIPFVYDGRKTYRLADLLPPNSGWDLATNTSSAAYSISEKGVIVGSGVHDGQVRAFAMIPKRR